MNDYLPEQQSQLKELENKLVSHLLETGIQDAIIYEPHKPEVYWAPNNLRIAFCNEEVYSTDGQYEPGINVLTSKKLENWTDGNKTINRVFDINFFIRKMLRSKELLTIEGLNQLKRDVSNKGKYYYWKYEEMDKSMYLNFRYSIPTDSSAEHKNDILKYYNMDPFYSKYYKEFLRITNPKILILGSELAVNLYNKIYSEFEKPISYCGEPEIHYDRIIVSMPHPGWMFYSDKHTLDVVNKVINEYSKLSEVYEMPSTIDEEKQLSETTPSKKKVVVIKKIVPKTTEMITKLSDAVIDNIKENPEAYTQTFNSIINAWKDCSVRAREVELEITKMNASHRNNLEKMDAIYQQRKNTISELLERIKDLQKQLDRLDLNNLSDEGHKTYRTLLEQMGNMSMMLLKLYEGIM